MKLFQNENEMKRKKTQKQKNNNNICVDVKISLRNRCDTQHDTNRNKWLTTNAGGFFVFVG